MESDNALLLALAALSRCGVKKAVLAGFDGFRSDTDDYFDSKYAFAGNASYSRSTNEITAAGISKLAEEMEIEFLTHSLYENTSE